MASTTTAAQAKSKDDYKNAHGGRVPVTVLTGFLGAGKTTLLNHLLSENHGLRFAIIENEFGEVGIDEHILGTDKLKEKIDEEPVYRTDMYYLCIVAAGSLTFFTLRIPCVFFFFAKPGSSRS